MSTTPITLPTFVNGQQGSASQLMQAFQYLFDAGQTNLTNLTNIRSNSLLEFERAISYLNSKNQQATKLISGTTLANFSITDFSTIDQSETTGTVRVDTGMVTCSEQTVNVEAVIKSITFSSSVGSIQTLNVNSNIYRVSNTNNQTPIGTFFIKLTEVINLSVLVFDLPSMVGNPNIVINVSETGVTYTPSLSFSLNGYRLVVNLTPAPIQYIQLVITPSQPDNLGGDLFTFGVTDFVGSSTEYRLLSEFVSQPLTFIPSSVNCQLSAPIVSGLLYFISIDGSNFVEVDLGQDIVLPGVSAITSLGATVASTGLLSVGLETGVYNQTLQVIDVSMGIAIPVIYGVTESNPLIGNLKGNYISVVGTSLYYLPYVSGDSTKTFNISYIKGPSTMTAQLKVQLSTSTNSSSPIFNGAVLIPA